MQTVEVSINMSSISLPTFRYMAIVYVGGRRITRDPCIAIIAGIWILSALLVAPLAINMRLETFRQLLQIIPSGGEAHT